MPSLVLTSLLCREGWLWISKFSFRKAIFPSTSLSPGSLEAWCLSITQHNTMQGCLLATWTLETIMPVQKSYLNYLTCHNMSPGLHSALSELPWVSQEILHPATKQNWERLSHMVWLFTNSYAGKEGWALEYSSPAHHSAQSAIMQSILDKKFLFKGHSSALKYVKHWSQPVIYLI